MGKLDTRRHPEVVPSAPVEPIFSGFKHSLALGSAYASFAHEPEVTFLVPQTDGTVLKETYDFIFYSQKNLEPCGLLPVPSLAEAAQEMEGCPTPKCHRIMCRLVRAFISNSQR